jgi:hypothetical protein
MRRKCRAALVTSTIVAGVVATLFCSEVRSPGFVKYLSAWLCFFLAISAFLFPTFLYFLHRSSLSGDNRVQFLENADNRVRMAIGGVFLLLLVVGGVMLAPGFFKVRKFNAAVQHLNTMLNTTGNDDSEVLASCAALEEAFKRVEISSVSKEQAAAMKDVVDSAKSWENQLSLIKLGAISSALGGRKDHNAATDLTIAKLTYSSIRNSVESYCKRYN